MSQPIKLIPDELRGAASHLSNLSSDANQNQQILERNWARLDSGWDWYAEGDINGHFRQAISEMSRMSAMLTQMGQAITQTAETVETADQSTVALFEDLISNAGVGSTGALPSAGTILPPLGGLIAPVDIPNAYGGGGDDDDDSWWKDLGERIRNWLNGDGWVTDEELAASTPEPEADPVQPDPTQTPTPDPTQTPEPDPTPTPEPDPTPTTTEQSVTASPFLYLRKSATTSADPEAEIPTGATVQVIDGVAPIEADGYTWVQVTYTDADGVHTGWVAQKYLGPVGEVVEGGALAIAPIGAAIISGWDFGDKEYKIPAGTVIGDEPYQQDTPIDQTAFNALSPTDQAKVIDQGNGQYIIPAGTTLEGTTYDEKTYIGEAEYNALNPADQAELTYIGMHPGIDISGSDTSLAANAAGTVYMYQARSDGTLQRYDTSNADNNQANDDLSGFGNYIVLETEVDGKTYYQIFAHLDSFDANLTQGQEIEAGTALGTMGSTGNSTGDHIHWEIRTDAGIDQDNNHGISVWFPADSSAMSTNFVDPDTFAAWLAAQPEEPSGDTDSTP